MKITAFTSGYSGREYSSFAVLCKTSDDEYSNTVYLSSEVSANQAELLALYYAINAIQITKTDLVVYTNSPYVYGMMQKIDDAWERTPQNFSELIQKIRDRLESFDSFFVKIDKTNAELQKVKKAARVRYQPDRNHKGSLIKS